MHITGGYAFYNTIGGFANPTHNTVYAFAGTCLTAVGSRTVVAYMILQMISAQHNYRLVCNTVLLMISVQNNDRLVCNTVLLQ